MASVCHPARLHGSYVRSQLRRWQYGNARRTGPSMCTAPIATRGYVQYARRMVGMRHQPARLLGPWMHHAHACVGAVGRCCAPKRKSGQAKPEEEQSSSQARGAQNSDSTKWRAVPYNVFFYEKTFNLFIFYHGSTTNTRNNKNYIQICRPSSDYNH